MAKIKHLNRSLPPNASKGQKHLAKILNEIFCSNGACMTLLYEHPLSSFAEPDVVEDYGVTGMSVDFYIKELNIAVEYQGSQHYTTSSLFGSSVARDIRKREFLNDVNVKLVEVPYTMGDDFTSEQIRLLLLGDK
jgi:hypothetical protein